MRKLITTYKKLEHSSSKNKSEDAASNSNLQPQYPPTQFLTPPSGTSSGFATGMPYNSPILISDDESSSSSDSDKELTGADSTIKILRRGLKQKKEPVYNNYENVVLPQLVSLRQRKDEIMRNRRQPVSSEKSNEHSESSTPSQANKEY